VRARPDGTGYALPRERSEPANGARFEAAPARSTCSTRVRIRFGQARRARNRSTEGRSNALGVLQAPGSGPRRPFRAFDLVVPIPTKGRTRPVSGPRRPFCSALCCYENEGRTLGNIPVASPSHRGSRSGRRPNHPPHPAPGADCATTTGRPTPAAQGAGPGNAGPRLAAPIAGSGPGPAATAIAITRPCRGSARSQTRLGRGRAGEERPQPRHAESAKEWRPPGEARRPTIGPSARSCAPPGRRRAGRPPPPSRAAPRRPRRSRCGGARCA
jgi:hypothetical protein